MLTEITGIQMAELCLVSNPGIDDLDVLRDLTVGLPRVAKRWHQIVRKVHSFWLK